MKTHNQLSKDTITNRENATRINLSFVIFLVAVCVAILFSSVRYLRLKSEITMRMEDVAIVESRLSTLREENDALYSQIISLSDLSEIKKEALGRLHMSYPTDEQTETYETSRSSYVRQYQDVPETK